MPTEQEGGQYLLDCFDTVYRVLGEGAQRLSEDAYVVRAYEPARAFGGFALDLRGCLDEPAVRPVEVLEGVLAHSIDADQSGAMAMFALVAVVGPRLLVSLLDARRTLGEGALSEVCDRASQVVVGEIRAAGETARNQAPIDDPSWQAAARSLSETLEGAGYAESMGISR